MVAAQETNGGGPGKHLMSQEPIVRVQEINGLCSGNQWLRSRKAMDGAQETNGWCTGNKCFESRKPMAPPVQHTRGSQGW